MEEKRGEKREKGLREEENKREEREKTGKWAERGRQHVPSFDLISFIQRLKKMRHATSLGTIEFPIYIYI